MYRPGVEAQRRKQPRKRETASRCEGEREGTDVYMANCSIKLTARFWFCKFATVCTRAHARTHAKRNPSLGLAARTIYKAGRVSFRRGRSRPTRVWIWSQPIEPTGTPVPTQRASIKGPNGKGLCRVMATLQKVGIPVEISRERATNDWRRRRHRKKLLCSAGERAPEMPLGPGQSLMISLLFAHQFKPRRPLCPPPTPAPPTIARTFAECLEYHPRFSILCENLTVFSKQFNTFPDICLHQDVTDEFFLVASILVPIERQEQERSNIQIRNTTRHTDEKIADCFTDFYSDRSQKCRSQCVSVYRCQARLDAVSSNSTQRRHFIQLDGNKCYCRPQWRKCVLANNKPSCVQPAMINAEVSADYTFLSKSYITE
ncbi:hypothetical protein DBV15_09185 [Temnothorax longispinosus]|uniref:Uncharacterized protein n=1 Tax=Temnothorax longispinosus TaxID=300112 RepID=A0A4S2KNS3_9HYME|nr:hypothetical protein DBV15_09185 [Temnothorax longispinosus]